ncbi:beta-mannosidase [Gorillibacterium sp. sgz5001074]|uniref:beta-mannosidase n=1 Tax=Gorillibacterium sp. sgz5001074 TaxID=3446695 RepID=UPI003F677AB8
MIKLDLGGAWSMRRIGDSDWLDAAVPGSVYADLLRAGRMEDPFYRDNEDAALALCDEDYEYIRTFEAEPDMLAADRLLLRCEGLDTLAELYLNGTHVASTDNMHRTYEWEVRHLLQSGSNELRIILRSPTRYAAVKHADNPIWGADDAVSGFNHLRKGHSMFGWDWGPQLPDLGIWRPISLAAYHIGRLEDVRVRQQHTQGTVTVSAEVAADVWAEPGSPVDAALTFTAPDGTVLHRESRRVEAGHRTVDFQWVVNDPELWWPNGYGKQPLYELTVRLERNGTLLDSKSFTIGLRTLRVKREKDEWGEGFAFEINGIPIFIQGANYIPEDNILSRVKPQQTDRLLRDCLEANFNCVRVWGGGIYPSDDFYDRCDRYGLIVWQDFMFACAFYEMNDAFSENIRQEAIDNIKRLRHHASLALWCGNNEMEEAWVSWDIPGKTPKLRTDYLKQFEILLADVVKRYDPDRDYWPSSPSSGGSFDQPNDENRGDVHYWEVWHGQKPFTEYRKHHFRFCSEFGFQSFPSPKTVRTFTLPEDRNIFSYVMERHQKNKAANGKILYYLSDNLKYPKDFDSLLYSSQMLQAEAIKYGVEHWRRNRGRCMGSIYWQLNDCWPVASWSSMDNFGRWKALHYFAKRFYAPVLLSAKDEGPKVELHLTNDTLSPVTGTVSWWLKDRSGQVLKESSLDVTVPALQAQMCTGLDFSDDLKAKGANRRLYLEYALDIGGQEISRATVLFTKPKHFEFEDPSIITEIAEQQDAFAITLRSGSFAKYVTLELTEADGVFSDNSFDLSAGVPVTVLLAKERLSAPLELEELRRQLTVQSLYQWS